jgi:rhodanese-related sulfurtransferase
MAIAVPANLQCGGPEDREAPAAPSWAPLTMTFAGIAEIQPAVVEEMLGALQVIDVRESAEWNGPLGHIASAKLVPLGELAARAGEIDRERPVVAVCRSGARSAQAVAILRKAGFTRVANMAGGMIRWRSSGLAADGGLD